MNIQKIREVFLKIVLSLLFFNIFYLPILILNTISTTIFLISILSAVLITKVKY